MDELIGTLSLKLHIRPTEHRGKMVQLHSWPDVKREQCEELLEAFFQRNERLDLRQCHAQWVVNELVRIPSPTGPKRVKIA